MNKWLNCIVSAGQFPGEYAIRGQMFNGRPFSLFAEERDVKLRSNPSPNNKVPGLLRILPIEEKGDFLLVQLPQATFENGQIITVLKRETQNDPIECGTSKSPR